MAQIMNINLFTPPPSAPWIVTYAPLLSAVATLLAVLVALFRESVVLYIRRPVLDLEVILQPPHCALSSFRSPSFSGLIPAYFLRVWVTNTGRLTATRVQVFVERLEKEVNGRQFEIVSSFLPMNLRWSHSQDEPIVFAEGIAPEMGQHCEFGVIVVPVAPPADPALLPVRVQMQTEVQPVSGTSELPAGIYKTRKLGITW